MDGNRFDNLAVSLVDAESSRRSLLARLVAGGFAAARAALGIGGFSAEDAEAKKKGGRKRGRRKKAKTCEQKCNKRGKRKRGGKGKGGRKGKKSSQSKAACLAKCNPAGAGGGGGGGGTPGTPGFPIDPGTPGIVPGTTCTVATGEGCAANFSCVSTGGITGTTGVCLEQCPLGTECDDAVENCIDIGAASVCLPLDIDRD